MVWAAFLAFLLYPLNLRLRRRLSGPGLAAGILTTLTPVIGLLPLSALSIDFVAQISALMQKVQKSAAELDIKSMSACWSERRRDSCRAGAARATMRKSGRRSTRARLPSKRATLRKPTAYARPCWPKA